MGTQFSLMLQHVVAEEVSVVSNPGSWMSHMVTHPVGSEIELISYCSSEVPSHSAYVKICYIPYWV